MSEVLRDLVVSLSLDGDNFSRNLTSINKQIQEAESEFRRAASGVENFEKSVSGTQSQLSSLQQKLALQQKAVKQYEKALEAANKKLEKERRAGSAAVADSARNRAYRQIRQSRTNARESEHFRFRAQCGGNAPNFRIGYRPHVLCAETYGGGSHIIPEAGRVWPRAVGKGGFCRKRTGLNSE